MQKHHISVSEALSQLRQARPIVEPNEGFMKQLELYHQMQTPDNVEDTPAYQRWVYQREIELSRAVGQAPEAEKIRFEDEHATHQNASFELRCRKCRSVKHYHSTFRLERPLILPPTFCSALTHMQATARNITIPSRSQSTKQQQRAGRESSRSNHGT